MRVVVTGGTGFIGRTLVGALVARGDAVGVPTRDPARARALLGPAVAAVAWNGRDPEPLARLLAGPRPCAVVNLAGEPIAAGRWTFARKARILESRVLAGRAVAEAASMAEAPPAVVVQGSAVGYYGPRASRSGDVLGESRPCGPGFLAEVCRQWEASSEAVEGLGTRRVVIRTGLVLGPGGGMLARMLPAFRLFLGGPLGGGGQWLPWVHLADVVGAVLWLLDDASASGPYNLCAPKAATMAGFCRELGKAMGRPSWLAVPSPVLALLLGAEMARETVLASQRAAPLRLDAGGYHFVLPDLGQALAACLDGRPEPPGGRTSPQ
ncbi:TIGR01777 family oxidoreductase [Desulfocurvus vexinensis]|uniref:TIGR01777 family oxidoreductase n=1 Tax=Desulfocurvus vexinensis TaxID=399548 RepID=UPI0004912A8D|nr:TIGR01777 family oxidoreductase [Desulfocurvus vexinensis]